MDTGRGLTHRDDAFIDGLLVGKVVGTASWFVIVGSFLAGGCCGRDGLVSPVSCHWEGTGGFGSVGRAGTWLCIELTPGPAFSLGRPERPDQVWVLPGKRGVSPAPCNPPTWQHWLDPAPKGTSAAGGSIQSGPWPSQWWSLLGFGIYLLWVPSEPVSSNLQDTFRQHVEVGMGNPFPFWCCPRMEALLVCKCVLKSLGCGVMHGKRQAT